MPRRHTPIRHDRFVSGAPCVRKRGFKDEDAARKAIETAELYDIRLELTTYQCPYCGKWHLSSAKPSK